MNVSNPYATLNIQIKPLMENKIVTESLFIMARYQKMPVLSNCDFIHSVSTIINTDGNYSRGKKDKDPYNISTIEMGSL